MNDLLPPPNLLGAPEKFDHWNEDQAEALLRAIDSERRFVGLVLPTGKGKTLIGPMLHYLTGKRTAILTSTKGLQDQIIREKFEGLVDAKGQSAYECLAVRPGAPLFGSVDSPATCDRGPCRARVLCPLKESGCLYYDNRRAAMQAPLLVTNYAYWMTQRRFGQGLGQFEILVLDEAHAAPDELAGFLSTELKHSDVKNLIGAALPFVPHGLEPRDGMKVWRSWADPLAAKLKREVERPDEDDNNGVAAMRSGKDIGRHIRLAHLYRVLDLIAKMNPDDWLFHEDVDRTVFDPVWVAGYAEPSLFQGIPKIILMSATFRPKTADLLGLDRADVDFYEARSGFDPARRPIYVVRTDPPTRVDWKMNDDAKKRWHGLINNILDTRKDRNALVHSVSYKRRNEIIQASRHADRMLSHASENARQVVEQFKGLKNTGAVLVSPSVTTGYDFPYTECEVQIITKVPFPDARDPILQARTQEDPDYPAYIAMQELVQAVGRGMRAPDDRCETFIIDDHARWFLSKYRDLAPQWFHTAIRRVDSLPAPLPKLSTPLAEEQE